MTNLDHSPSPTIDEQPTSRPWLRVLFLIGAATFVAFWTWALFFASKAAVNGIDDPSWTADAEAICADADDVRQQLANYTRLDEGGEELIYQRADIVEEATDIVAAMVDDLEALTLNTAKGQALVPQWIADYRVLLDDRYDYVEQLRVTGENLSFYESATEDGIPITEKLETFAGDNQMPSCAPPRDISQ